MSVPIIISEYDELPCFLWGENQYKECPMREKWHEGEIRMCPTCGWQIHYES